MTVDIEVKVTCDECKKVIDDYSSNFICDDCLADIIDDWLKEAIIWASKNDYRWKDKDSYTGWETEKEKEIFMQGIKMGFFDALFEIATFRGDKIIHIWEEIEELAYGEERKQKMR